MRTLEFEELRGDPTLTELGLLMAGRCMHDEIRIGDRFTVLVQSGGSESSICVGVVEIVLYGQPVRSIARNLSCELLLIGVTEEGFKAGVVLHGLGGD
jgi:hypothetical protein